MRFLTLSARQFFVALVIVVSLLTMILISMTHTTSIHHVLGAETSSHTPLHTSARTLIPWQPPLAKVRQVYRHLNIPQSQLSAVFPLTVKGRLLLNNPRLCLTARAGEESMGPIDVLFMVHTALLHFKHRNLLRDTIANHSYFYPFKVRILFLLGLPTDDTNGTVQSLIELEHKKYGDTLQGNFIDTYNNLTHKGVMGYRWISQYCPHVRLVAKIDDDVFVDTFKLLHRFWPVLFVAKSRAIFCNVWHNNTMLILREGKWKVNEDVLQHFQVFPWNYCSGMAVFITGDLIPYLYQAAFYTPFFWIDDVYLFGMLPGVVGNVTYYDIGFSKNMSLNHNEALQCMKTQGSTCPIVAMGSSLEAFPDMWNVTYQIHRSSWKLEAKKIE